MPEIYNNAPHLMKTDLLNRGWTTTSINRYLPHPIVEYRRSHRGTYSVHLWPQSTIESAETSAEVKVYIDTIKKRRESASLTLEIPLLDATREASRSAHRWRDRADNAWNDGHRRCARTCSINKRHWYGLKERGIVALHKAGELRYAGVSPQGMAVYEYGEGGLKCLHSTLHPVGVERTPVEGHPEILLVPAKKQEIRLRDVEQTLSNLEVQMIGYERSSAPAHKRVREEPTCWRCCDVGHLASECGQHEGMTGCE